MTDDAATVEALAALAALELAPERRDELAAQVAGMRDALAALREQPIDLEPAVVFDPRWD